MGVDKFEGSGQSLTSPAAGHFDVTPSDSVDLAIYTRAINVAGTGTVQVTDINDVTGPVYVAAGVAFPIRAKRIWATGSTATGIVGLY